MKKEIKQFKKFFLAYVETNEKVLAQEEDMFYFAKGRPLVSFNFDSKKVFITEDNGKYLVGYYGIFSDREEFETLNQCFKWLRKHLDTESKYDYSARIAEPLHRQINEKRIAIIELSSKLNETKNETIIAKVIHNKGTTVVWFKDKEKVVVRKAKGEKDSVYSAVAYAIAKRLYGNNSHFQSVVDKAECH